MNLDPIYHPVGNIEGAHLIIGIDAPVDEYIPAFVFGQISPRGAVFCTRVKFIGLAVFADNYIDNWSVSNRDLDKKAIPLSGEINGYPFSYLQRSIGQDLNIHNQFFHGQGPISQCWWCHEGKNQQETGNYA